MNKRLLKRHKRQVTRAKEGGKTSEPDLRTPEELKAAREASRPTGIRGGGPQPLYNSPTIRSRTGSAAKTDA